MDYAEIAPPPDLRLLVKCGWTLSVPDGPDAWRTHVATPDGCMELIRRLEGRSVWGEEQPSCFVAGMTTRPAELRLRAGSRFVGLRIWPWTWRALSGQSPEELIDRWAPAGAYSVSSQASFDILRGVVLDPRASAIAEAVLTARAVRDVCAYAGLPRRALQRWFERNVGVAPRAYRRLLRFSEAFGDLPRSDSSLADHAACHGFADQAHMSRDFRAMAGSSAATARKSATGPFLTNPGNSALPS